MSHELTSRRNFLAGATAGAGLFSFENSIKLAAAFAEGFGWSGFRQAVETAPTYTLRIASSPIEIAPKRTAKV